MSGRGSDDDAGYRPFCGAYGRLGSGQGIEGQRVINKDDFGDDDALDRVLARSHQEVSGKGGSNAAGSSAADRISLLDREFLERVYLKFDSV